MNAPPGTPEGHRPCPRCGTAVLLNAPVCPNCGERQGPVLPRRSRYTGAIVLLTGLGLAGLGGAGFFGTCLAAISNTEFSKGAASGLIMGGFGVAALIGFVMMLVGFVMLLVQAFRR